MEKTFREGLDEWICTCRRKKLSSCSNVLFYLASIMTKPRSRKAWPLWPLTVYQVGLSTISGMITWTSLEEGTRWSNSSFPDSKAARITFQFAFAGLAGVVTIGLAIAAGVSVYGLICHRAPQGLIRWQPLALAITGMTALFSFAVVPRFEGSHTDLFPGLECLAMAVTCGLAVPAAIAQRRLLRTSHDISDPPM